MPATFDMQSGSPRFCGVSERLLEEANARQSRWVNKRKLTYCRVDRLPGLTADILDAAYAMAFGHWQAICGLTFTPTLDKHGADFQILARKIDRGGGVLAEHELPPGNDQPLRGWFDTSEAWTNQSPPGAGKIDLIAVATHEFGHGLGLSHTNKPGNLLNPYYDPKIRTPREWDIAEAQARYGPPVEEPKPPTLPPGMLPDAFPGVCEIFGRVYSVQFTRKL